MDIIAASVARDIGVGAVGPGRDLLDVVDVGEGATGLRCLPGYFDVFIRVELVDLNAKPDFSIFDLCAGDV